MNLNVKLFQEPRESLSFVEILAQNDGNLKRIIKPGINRLGLQNGGRH